LGLVAEIDFVKFLALADIKRVFENLTVSLDIAFNTIFPFQGPIFFPILSQAIELRSVVLAWRHVCLIF